MPEAAYGHDHLLREKGSVGQLHECAKIFYEAIAGSEGSERERYTKIYAELVIGKSVCTDGEEK